MESINISNLATSDSNFDAISLESCKNTSFVGWCSFSEHFQVLEDPLDLVWVINTIEHNFIVELCCIHNN
jgi:hypothetical protein